MQKTISLVKPLVAKPVRSSSLLHACDVLHEPGLGMSRFPEKLRLDVSIAVACMAGPEDALGNAIRLTNGLQNVYRLGGARALLEWCKTIRECGAFLGNEATLGTIIKLVTWAETQVTGNERRATAYREHALRTAAAALRDNTICGLLEETGQAPDTAALAGILSARWGIERTRELARGIANTEITGQAFISGALELAGESRQTLDGLTRMLHQDGRLFWAVPAINRSTLGKWLSRPGELITAVLKHEGMPCNALQFTLAERKKKLGRLSAIMDRRALKHPDRAVRKAAISRLVDVAVGNQLEEWGIALTKFIAGHYQYLGERDYAKLRPLLRTGDDDVNTYVGFAFLQRFRDEGMIDGEVIARCARGMDIPKWKWAGPNVRTRKASHYTTRIIPLLAGAIIRWQERDKSSAKKIAHEIARASGCIGTVPIGPEKASEIIRTMPAAVEMLEKFSGRPDVAAAVAGRFCTEEGYETTRIYVGFVGRLGLYPDTAMKAAGILHETATVIAQLSRLPDTEIVWDSTKWRYTHPLLERVNECVKEYLSCAMAAGEMTDLLEVVYPFRIATSPPNLSKILNMLGFAWHDAINNMIFKTDEHGNRIINQDLPGGYLKRVMADRPIAFALLSSYR